ncbi:MAG: phenylalanine--tRNA ligase subunit beta [Nanoarchaeota archaeon]|nr:phenylalanine--tRNA ligase subunit beta [Nanoarchaeota archaeon]
MPTINVNRSVLEKLIGKKLSEKALAERINYLGLSVEEIGEDEISIEVEPNRPDMLSEQGLGRALASFVGNKPGLREYSAKSSGQKCFVQKGMEKIRPYTACCIVRNLKLDDDKIKEIIDVQEKLHITFCRRRKKAAIGIYPCEKIKFPIYLKSDQPDRIVFRPLEFPKEINARQILSQHPAGREYAHLVENLDRYAYFSDSEAKVLSFTPIINSHLTGKITEETKEAFIEVSGFDLNICRMVLNILVTAISDMGGRIESMEVVYPDKKIRTPDLSFKKMKVELDYVNKKLGLDLKEKDLKALLAKMGFGYQDRIALIPCYRADIIHQIDLVEDIAIAYGFENFVPKIPNKATIGQESPIEVFKSKIANLLVGLNTFEVSTYHISSKEKETVFMECEKDVVELANALTIDYNILRTWILPSLMQVLKDNLHNEYPQEIFEIGYAFEKDEAEDTGVREDSHLAFISCAKDTDYTRARQVMDYLFSSIGLCYEVKEDDLPSFIPGRSGRIFVENIEVGILGELHPKVLGNFSVGMPASGFEVNLDRLFSIFAQEDELFIDEGVFLLSREIKEKFPLLLLATETIKEVKIKNKEEAHEVIKKKLIDKWKGAKNIEENKELLQYRVFHEKLGLTDVASAAEAIIKRYLSLGKFPDINSAVDAGNIASVEELTSIGLFDLDKISGKIKVRFARDGDEYLPYGQKNNQKIKPGRIILEDDDRIFAVVGYKDSQKTSVDLSTKNLLIVTWGEEGKDEKKMERVLRRVRELLEQKQ